VKCAARGGIEYGEFSGAEKLAIFPLLPVESMLHSNVRN
jgi:hypothetical protein